MRCTRTDARAATAKYDRRVRAPDGRFRMAALLLAGALAVHDLRVLVGYGEDAELILREPAHAYLPFATGLTWL